MKEGINSLNPEMLVCGQRIRLLAIETTRSKWNTTLAGSRPGKYIILEVPKVNGLPVYLDDYSHWYLNFIYRGQIVNFSSKVLGTIIRPFPLVFFSYPEHVEISNLRTEKRYPVHIPVTLEGTLEPRRILTKGLLLDLSWSGCLTATQVEIPNDEPISMNLYLETNNTIEGLLIGKKGSRNQFGTFYTGFGILPNNKNKVIEKLGEYISDIESMHLRI
ncbi:MAG: flagellar brake protein [Deltaproteobacteria bacterium]|nr:flagellar brake protein [Deltaproteobacteria bacterium]